MFILHMTVQLYTLHAQHYYATTIFEAKVKETETPACVKRESPAHIKVWLRGRRDISSARPIKLNKVDHGALVKYLLSKEALGKVASQGARGVLGNIPGVQYRLGKKGLVALDTAIREYGIEIIDERR